MRETENQRLRRRYHELRARPWSELFQRGADKLWVYASTPVVAARRSGATFECLGESYRYFTHPYNATWRNERAVEIPIALRFLAQNRGQRVLERYGLTETLINTAVRAGASFPWRPLTRRVSLCAPAWPPHHGSLRFEPGWDERPCRR